MLHYTQAQCLITDMRSIFAELAEDPAYALAAYSLDMAIAETEMVAARRDVGLPDIPVFDNPQKVLNSVKLMAERHEGKKNAA